MSSIEATNALQVFKYSSEVNVRVAGTADNPLFCAKDVCLILGLENNRQATSRLRPEELHVIGNDTSVGKRAMTFITESGLYRLIFTSKKKEAEDFRTWVFSEVLPAIRKTGEYKVKTQSLEIKEKEMEVLQKGINILQSIHCMDDRARALIFSTTMNIFQDINTAPRDMSREEDEEWSISRRVQFKFGRNLSCKRDRTLLCSLGRTISKEYEIRYGTKPLKRTQYVDGTLREVMHYTLRDYEQWIDAILSRHF